MEDAIKSEFSGNSESGFLAIIRAIKDQPAFFARLLNNSLSGVGTDDKSLIRLIVTRCEIDMSDIKRAYQSKYGESLKEAIKVTSLFTYILKTQSRRFSNILPTISIYCPVVCNLFILVLQMKLYKNVVEYM